MRFKLLPQSLLLKENTFFFQLLVLEKLQDRWHRAGVSTGRVFPKEWDQLVFAGAGEVFGDVSLGWAADTAFVSSWSQLWTDAALSCWTWPADLDGVILHARRGVPQGGVMVSYSSSATLRTIQCTTEVLRGAGHYNSWQSNHVSKFMPTYNFLKYVTNIFWILASSFGL